MTGGWEADVKTLLANGARPFFQLILLTIFLAFFGWPIIETYGKKEVMTVEKKRNTYGIPAPAITISAWTQIEQTNDCYDLDGSIEKCIDAKSLNRSDLLQGALLGFDTRTVVNFTEDMFTEDSNHLWSGKHYTLNLPFKIGPNDATDQLYLFLANTTLFTTVFIHDPTFFVFTDNPDAIPMEFVSFKTRTSYSQVYRLDLIEMHELNVPSDPCNPNTDYNFKACVKKSVSEQVLFHQINSAFKKCFLFSIIVERKKLFQVGCSTKWDVPGTAPSCTNSKQFR